MKIRLSSVSVGDQEKALDFYTRVLGFIKKTDFAVGDARWLTVVSPEEPDGTELVLEPNAEYPEMKALKAALVRDGIPITAFQTDDVHREFERLKKLGVRFTREPVQSGTYIYAVLEDCCGNLVQIYQA